MENDKPSFWNHIQSVSQQVAKRSQYGTGMDSILLLIAMISPLSIALYAWVRESILLYIAAVPIVLFVLVYLFYMLVDRTMLRSEKHQEFIIRMTKGFGQKGKEIPENTLERLASVSPSDRHSDKKELNSGKVKKEKDNV